ncbi:hypothetical protein VNO77_10511 [Canavalia gladiata]|uniref:Uncharacterized protein n=1 Tax=Canavalia gladiata TaxID=3824 RepID=A0AAN9ME64_CANGL
MVVTLVVVLAAEEVGTGSGRSKYYKVSMLTCTMLFVRALVTECSLPPRVFVGEQLILKWDSCTSSLEMRDVIYKKNLA